MKKLLIVISGFILLTNLSAQETDVKPSKKNEIGINAGATTGLGLSYRHWFGKAGFQLTALPIKTDKTTIISVGLTALYSFYDAHYVRVYGFLGNHYFVDKESGTNQIWDNNSNTFNGTQKTTYDHSSYNIGIGPGFAFGKAVRFNFMIGYGFYDVLDKIEMYPTGEIGIYYNF
jgi:hypothetical protein